jgi:hypothetical protein
MSPLQITWLDFLRISCSSNLAIVDGKQNNEVAAELAFEFYQWELGGFRVNAARLDHGIELLRSVGMRKIGS